MIQLNNGKMSSCGQVSIERIRPIRMSSSKLFEILKRGLPLPSVDEFVRTWRLRNLRNLMRGFKRLAPAHLMGLAYFQGSLELKFIPKGSLRPFDLGLVSLRVVTNNGVAYMVDAFQNTVELENMKYHGFGVGTGNEAAADAALGTELTTEYNPDSTRPTGSTEEGATGNIFKTIATLTIDAGTPAVTEHGVFSASSAGVLLDRSKFSAINLSASDSIVSTYQFTLAAGS